MIMIACTVFEQVSDSDEDTNKCLIGSFVAQKTLCFTLVCFVFVALLHNIQVIFKICDISSQKAGYLIVP